MKRTAIAAASFLVAITSGAGDESRSSVMRRLTYSQYNNSVRDLVGDETRPADLFPEEDFVNGFKNQSVAQGIPPLLAESYNAAAERLAKNVFLGGDDSKHVLPCRPRNAEDAQCREQFIRQFGLRCFRRPLTATEFQRYSASFSRQARQTGDFLQGAQITIEAMLQSPKFLFRVERGPAGPWRGYEVASRLSYFLWDSTPDDELLRTAATGRLDDPAEVDKQVRRMLADPRARQALDEFVAEWLRFDLALGMVKDREVYPEFTPELAAAMTEESRRLIQDTVWNDRNFMEILTADYGFLNSDLAKLYGVVPPARDFDRVSFPADSDRGGILGGAAFLALTSKPGETSPTVRGRFVQDQFLCLEVPDPPPGTNSNLPPLTVDKPQTNRERMTEHLSNPSCAGCHTLMDPIGFGLEKFDPVGRRREKQTITFLPQRRKRGDKAVHVELDLDTRGSIAGIPNSDFSSPKQLGAILAKSPQCQECVVKQLFRYAYGRREMGADRPAIQQGLKVFRESQFRLKSLMIFLARSVAYPEARS